MQTIGQQSSSVQMQLHEVVVIPPGGHAEICCGTLLPLLNGDGMKGPIMSKEQAETLSTLDLTPEAVNHYLTLPVNERKELEGLDKVSLSAAIMKKYEGALLSHFERPLPPALSKVFLTLTKSEQEGILTLPDQEMMEIMLSMRLTSSTEIAADAKKQAEETHKGIVAAAENEQLRLFSPLPTELTRCSPFFPMSTKEMAKRDYIENLIIADHSWGRLRFSGQKLSIYDEDSLLVLLAAINETNHSRFAEGYTYSGPIMSLLRIKGITVPGQNHREEVYKSYKRMSGSVFEIEKPAAQKGKSSRVGTSTVNNIIINLDYNRKAGHISVTVNPYFFEMYCSGEVTWLDVKIRTKLNSPVSKALYRFIQSHQKDYWTGPILLLAKSLNLDIELQMNKIRARLKKAILELIEFDILLPSSAIVNDNVTIRRTPRKPAKKQLPEKTYQGQK